jgi:1-acyl-sn-glycerol-3-phosphate acyltransferase
MKSEVQSPKSKVGAEPSPAASARLRPIYRAAWLAMRLVSATYFNWRVLGVENVPLTGPVILAANHVSFADPPMIGCAVPRAISYLARDTLFTKPGLGWLIRQLNAVPVDRDGGGASGLKAILDRLHDGGGIILFPEGTRSPDGNLQAARSGVGLTVIKSEAPVVPVRLFGMFEAWPRSRACPRPGQVTLKFGRPLDFTALRAEAKTCSKPRLKAIYQQVTDEIMTTIGRLEPSEEIGRFPNH